MFLKLLFTVYSPPATVNPAHSNATVANHKFDSPSQSQLSSELEGYTPQPIEETMGMPPANSLANRDTIALAI